MDTGSKAAEMMEKYMCEQCDSYLTGCTPSQILYCIDRFVDVITKISKRVEKETSDAKQRL